MNIQIKRGVPFNATLTLYDESVTPKEPLDLTDKTVFISVKDKSDNADNDNLAFITSSITVHVDATNGQTLWELTAAETLIPFGQYKADIRVYTDATDFDNTDPFNVDIVKIVTKRTS